MSHISSKRSKRPLINQRIAELINRGKLPKSLWPRVHVGPGGAYLRRALICPSAHEGWQRIAQELVGNLREPLSRLWPIKLTQAKQQGRCFSSRPKDSRAMFSSLYSWPAHVENCCLRESEGRERKKSYQALPHCQNNNCTASRDTHQDPGHCMNLPAPASLSLSVVDCVAALALRHILPNKSGFVKQSENRGARLLLTRCL